VAVAALGRGLADLGADVDLATGCAAVMSELSSGASIPGSSDGRDAVGDAGRLVTDAG
jgi:hypothetical protein